MKKLYLAAPYSQRSQLRHLAHYLTFDTTIEVVARWLDGEHEAKDADPTPEDQAQWAADDLEDIDACDALVLFTDKPSRRGGCQFEAGYALGTGKRLIVVGPVVNVFHALPQVERFDDWHDARLWLIEWARDDGQVAA